MIEVHEYHLNNTLYDDVKNWLEDKEDDKSSKRFKEEIEYAIKCYKVDCTKLCNPDDNVKK